MKKRISVKQKIDNYRSNKSTNSTADTTISEGHFIPALQRSRIMPLMIDARNDARNIEEAPKTVIHKPSVVKSDNFLLNKSQFESYLKELKDIKQSIDKLYNKISRDYTSFRIIEELQNKAILTMVKYDDLYLVIYKITNARYLRDYFNYEDYRIYKITYNMPYDYNKLIHVGHARNHFNHYMRDRIDFFKTIEDETILLSLTYFKQSQGINGDSVKYKWCVHKCYDNYMEVFMRNFPNIKIYGLPQI